jgi:dCMP deaminase
MPRINWEEHALLIAWAATLRSEDPYMKVGACALGHQKEVLGVAYSGLAPGKIVEESFWSDRHKRRPFMIHAEANLLARISKLKLKKFQYCYSFCRQFEFVQRKMTYA